MSVTELLSGSGMRDVNDGHPASCECVDCDWGDEGIDDRGDVERLLDVLRRPVPEPARVKVRPLGSVRRLGTQKRIAWCRAGYSVTCTACGEVESLGFSDGGRPGNLSTAMEAGCAHIRRQHLEAAV